MKSQDKGHENMRFYWPVNLAQKPNNSKVPEVDARKKSFIIIRIKWIELKKGFLLGQN